METCIHSAHRDTRGKDLALQHGGKLQGALLSSQHFQQSLQSQREDEHAGHHWDEDDTLIVAVNDCIQYKTFVYETEVTKSIPQI